MLVATVIGPIKPRERDAQNNPPQIKKVRIIAAFEILALHDARSGGVKENCAGGVLSSKNSGGVCGNGGVRHYQIVEIHHLQNWRVESGEQFARDDHKL